VAHDDGRLRPDRVEDADDVAHEVELRVVLDRGRRRRGAVAPLVGGDDVPAGVRERPELVAPRPPALREPVQQQDDRPAVRPRLREVERQAAELDRPVADAGQLRVGQFSCPSCAGRSS
jgi:hypothetical protein